MYYFDHLPSHKKNPKGVDHGADLDYLFDDFTVSTDDRMLQLQMVTYWTNFAKTVKDLL